MPNPPRLFFASCISLVTTAMVFAIRGDVADAIGHTFHLDNAQLGLIFSPAFWCFTVAIFVSGAFVDRLGMRRLHVLSALGYFLGIALILCAPRPEHAVQSIFDHRGTTLLYVGFMVLGLSQGLVEAVINPLVTTLYGDRKTHQLNMLHAWWPGGLVIGGIAAWIMTQTFHARWELQMALILAPASVYLLLACSLQYPQTERVQSNVSTIEMWREVTRPLFLLLFGCMFMTAAAELGPDQWFPSVMGALVPKMQGVIYLVYTAGIVFLLRSFGASWVHRSPIRSLLLCSALTGVGLYWLGSLERGTNPLVAFLAATIFAVGKSYLWPTMIGVAAEQFPRGGALAISLMGGAGMLSVAAVLPIMGARIDRYGPAVALQITAILSALLVVVFAGLALHFRSKGGYRRVALGDV